MKRISTWIRLQIIGATVTGVYFFEHPRAWAGELPEPAAAPFMEALGVDGEDSE